MGLFLLLRSMGPLITVQGESIGSHQLTSQLTLAEGVIRRSLGLTMADNADSSFS
jgi:hypothetical protein